MLAAGAGGRLRRAPSRRADPRPAARSIVFVLAVVGFGVQGRHGPAARVAAARPPRGTQPRLGADVRRDGESRRLRPDPGVLRPVGGGARWWGLLLLALGAALGAATAMLQASVATDLKRLLAYSTTENVGLMGMGSAPRRCAPPTATGRSPRSLWPRRCSRAQPRRIQDGPVPRRRGRAARHRTARPRPARRAGPAHAVARRSSASARWARPRCPPDGFVSEWLLLQGLIHGDRGRADRPLVAGAMPVAVGRGRAHRRSGRRHVRQGVRRRVPRPAAVRRPRPAPRGARRRCAPAMGLAAAVCVVAARPLPGPVAAVPRASPPLRGTTPMARRGSARLPGSPGRVPVLDRAGCWRGRRQPWW